MESRCHIFNVYIIALILLISSLTPIVLSGCSTKPAVKFHEIVPGVYRIKASRSNVYLLASQTLTLVDTGMPGDGETIIKCIASIGRKPEEVSHILITHAHMDHTGSLAFLQKATGAKVVASVAEQDYIEGKKELWTMDREGVGGKIFKTVLFFMETFILKYQPAKVDMPCRGGESIDCFGGIEVIATPGHSPGSLSYYIPAKGIIFAGDALSGEPGLRLPPRAGCANYKQALESVKILSSLKYVICCFGHGEPAKRDADAQVKKLIAEIP